jgi:O-antigen ligase
METVQGEMQERNDHAIRRSEIWRSTLQLIRDYPIAGVGFGGYWQAITWYDKASGEASLQQAHNDYLELLASGGIAGAAFLTFFLIALARQLHDGIRSRRGLPQAACFGAACGLFGIALHSAVDFGLHTGVNALVCTALVVIASVKVRKRKEA